MTERIAHDDILRARRADLVDYLRSCGYELRREGNQFRLPGHGGLIIEGNHWYQHSAATGGNAVDFLVRVLGRDFQAAVRELAGARPAPPTAEVPIHMNHSYDALVKFPGHAHDARHVIAYLTRTRGLPYPLVREVLDTGLLYEDTRRNCVFMCGDPPGQWSGAILRGTNTFQPFKGRAQDSDAGYGWYWPPWAANPGAGLLVTESPIDAMSLVALGVLPDATAGRLHVLALGGLQPRGLRGFLERHPETARVVLALDNDEPGRQAAERWKSELERHGRVADVVFPEHGKDWNEQFLRVEETGREPVAPEADERYFEPDQGHLEAEAAWDR